MADEGPDLGYCDECGNFGEVVYVAAPGPTRADQYNEVTFCPMHAPLVLQSEDFEMIFDKAGVERGVTVLDRIQKGFERICKLQARKH
jgi:hypothetical protein